MQTLTIPKSLVGKGDLVVLPRRDYEQLVSDSSKEVIKRDPRIDRELAKSLDDIKHGRVYGPFSSVDEFMASLRRNQKRKKK
ncbi:MAG TPA: hypothetical protein VJB69_00665 [Candidatus Paceibacterota bacterium]